MKMLKLKMIAVFLLIVSCTKSDLIPDDVQVHDLVWKGLNAFYLWQPQIPDLQDTRFNSQIELNNYYQGFSTPEDLFESLLKKPDDRFSVMVDDYIALENSFQGISLSSGIEFGLVQYANNSGNVFGYVRYIIPNSDADNQGVTRGMIFNQINNQQLTLSNYIGLLFNNQTSVIVGFADYNNGNPTSNGTNISLIKSQLQENPIGLSKVIDYNGKKIGYLFYNQFASNFDGALNTVFATFKSAAINELIVDLRYNPGGSVRTATYLGSMITGQFSGQVFSKERWNTKAMRIFDPASLINNFTNTINNGSINQPINSLNLNRVYFITSDRTASASELVINSLRAYIDVRVVGDQTVGKQVGSITLYDSDNLQKNGPNFNRNHTYALQPIVLEITNKDDDNEPLGFNPSVNITGVKLRENYNDLGEIGELTDPLLRRTLVYIDTGAKPTFESNKENIQHQFVFDTKLALPTSNNMYVDFK